MTPAPRMRRYIAVIDTATGELVYQGRNEHKAAKALEPGTVIGYSVTSQEHADESAREWARDLARKS